MLPTLQLGPLVLPVPELLLLIGFWIGLEQTEKQSELFGVKAGPIYTMSLVAVIGGLIGGRLVYAAQSPSAFLSSPISLLSPRPQMLDGLGGLIAGAAVGLIYLRIKRLNLWQTLDALTTLLAILAVTLGLAHVASGDAFGAPANVPWAIPLWGELRHPTQIYETTVALMVAILTWSGGRVAKHSQTHPGFRLWMFIGLSAAARMVLETFRGDSILLLNSLREAQVIAWVVLGISLWQIGRRIHPLVVEANSR